MPAKAQIEFVLRDSVEGVELTPANIGLTRFNEYNQQVADFLAGSERLKLDEVVPTVTQGSYRLLTALPALVLAALEPDLRSLAREDSLGEVDPKRAEIIAKWQARSKARPELRYQVRPVGLSLKPIEITNKTDFREGEIAPWVRVEKYLFGTLMDMGGVQKANLHVRVDDTGQVVRIGSNQGYLKDQSENRLYRKVLLRVEAEQHYRTGALRSYRLLSFEDYRPGYDEAALDRFAAAGAQAWKDVPDAAEWVRQLRGGGA